MIHDHSKWGPADQVGAGNLLTVEKRLAALASVKHGRVYDVSHEIFMGAPYMAPNQTPYLMSIFGSWRDTIKRRRKMGATNDAGTNLERIEMTTHVGTHIDALGHFSKGDMLYNGNCAADVVTDWGLDRLGIEHAVEITVFIAHDVRRIGGRHEPLAFARDKLEALPPAEKLRGVAFPREHAFALQFGRLESPCVIADGRLPLVEITREIDRIARRIDVAAVLQRQHKRDRAIAAVEKISVGPAGRQPRCRRQGGQHRTACAQRKFRMRPPRPVAIELDDAGGRRFEPGADDAVRFCHEGPPAFAGPAKRQAGNTRDNRLPRAVPR